MVFSMPMYREFVPKSVRPWIYVFFAIVFQLSGGIYLGTLSNMMGTTSFMREDVLMIGLCGVVGVCMPFPLLFRFKFRFTNRQLLLGAALNCPVQPAVHARAKYPRPLRHLFHSRIPEVVRNIRVHVQHPALDGPRA